MASLLKKWPKSIPTWLSAIKTGKSRVCDYSAINAMLLNEFLKEHQAFLEEKRKVQRLEAALNAVNQRLKEQEAKIEKVSAQIEMNKPGRQVVSKQSV